MVVTLLFPLFSVASLPLFVFVSPFRFVSVGIFVSFLLFSPYLPPLYLSLSLAFLPFLIHFSSFTFAIRKISIFRFSLLFSQSQYSLSRFCHFCFLNYVSSPFLCPHPIPHSLSLIIFMFIFIFSLFPSCLYPFYLFPSFLSPSPSSLIPTFIVSTAIPRSSLSLLPYFLSFLSLSLLSPSLFFFLTFHLYHFYCSPSFLPPSLSFDLICISSLLSSYSCSGYFIVLFSSSSSLAPLCSLTSHGPA